MEKTLGQVAFDAMDSAWSMPALESWQAVADAVVAEYERRRWKAAFANLPAPPKEADHAK